MNSIQFRLNRFNEICDRTEGNRAACLIGSSHSHLQSEGFSMELSQNNPSFVNIIFMFSRIPELQAQINFSSPLYGCCQFNRETCLFSTFKSTPYLSSFGPCKQEDT